MRRPQTRPLLLIALCLLTPVVGCGGPVEASKALLIPVKGKLTYKGQPLTKGRVQFEPRDEGRVASGDLQADGSFVLSTFKANDGALPGTHRVSVTGTGKGFAGSASVKAGGEIVPIKYIQGNTSGLVAEVSEASAEFTFDLK